MKSIFSLKTTVIIFLTILGGAFAAPYCSATPDSPADEKIEAWADNHPRAAAELGAWVESHTEAARALFKWDYKHPEQSKEFVTWVATHLGKKMDIFVDEHPDWHYFIKITTKHRAEIGDFLTWCRFHPKASAALMQHSRALHWVGQHLYKVCPTPKDV